MVKRTAQAAAVMVLCVSVLVAWLAYPSAASEKKGDAKAGLEVYKKTCLRCHGEKCKGDGPGAKFLKTKPADWTDKTRMSKLTESDLYTVVDKGGVALGQSSAMPAFGKTLKQQEISDVVAYILQVEGKQVPHPRE
jgi:mono/diheme cytochrome c family protein